MSSASKQLERRCPVGPEEVGPTPPAHASGWAGLLLGQQQHAGAPGSHMPPPQGEAWAAGPGAQPRFLLMPPPPLECTSHLPASSEHTQPRLCTQPLQALAITSLNLPKAPSSLPRLTYHMPPHGAPDPAPDVRADGVRSLADLLLPLRPCTPEERRSPACASPHLQAR